MPVSTADVQDFVSGLRQVNDIPDASFLAHCKDYLAKFYQDNYLDFRPADTKLKALNVTLCTQVRDMKIELAKSQEAAVEARAEQKQQAEANSVALTSLQILLADTQDELRMATAELQRRRLATLRTECNVAAADSKVRNAMRNAAQTKHGILVDDVVKLLDEAPPVSIVFRQLISRAAKHQTLKGQNKEDGWTRGAFRELFVFAQTLFKKLGRHMYKVFIDVLGRTGYEVWPSISTLLRAKAEDIEAFREAHILVDFNAEHYKKVAQAARNFYEKLVGDISGMVFQLCLDDVAIGDEACIFVMGEEIVGFGVRKDDGSHGPLRLVKGTAIDQLHLQFGSKTIAAKAQVWLLCPVSEKYASMTTIIVARPNPLPFKAEALEQDRVSIIAALTTAGFKMRGTYGDGDSVHRQAMTKTMSSGDRQAFNKKFGKETTKHLYLFCNNAAHIFAQDPTHGGKKPTKAVMKRIILMGDQHVIFQDWFDVHLADPGLLKKRVLLFKDAQSWDNVTGYMNKDVRRVLAEHGHVGSVIYSFVLANMLAPVFDRRPEITPVHRYYGLCFCLYFLRFWCSWQRSTLGIKADNLPTLSSIRDMLSICHAMMLLILDYNENPWSGGLQLWRFGSDQCEKKFAALRVQFLDGNMNWAQFVSALVQLIRENNLFAEAVSEHRGRSMSTMDVDTADSSRASTTASSSTEIFNEQAEAALETVIDVCMTIGLLKTRPTADFLANLPFQDEKIMQTKEEQKAQDALRAAAATTSARNVPVVEAKAASDDDTGLTGSAGDPIGGESVLLDSDDDTRVECDEASCALAESDDDVSDDVGSDNGGEFELAFRNVCLGVDASSNWKTLRNMALVAVAQKEGLPHVKLNDMTNDTIDTHRDAGVVQSSQKHATQDEKQLHNAKSRKWWSCFVSGARQLQKPADKLDTLHAVLKYMGLGEAKVYVGRPAVNPATQVRRNIQSLQVAQRRPAAVSNRFISNRASRQFAESKKKVVDISSSKHHLKIGSMF